MHRRKEGNVKAEVKRLKQAYEMDRRKEGNVEAEFRKLNRHTK